MSKLSQSKAQAALAAVKAQWATDLTPQTIEGTTYDPLYPEPVLVEDWDGPGWVVVWEEGPEEWIYLLGGGTSEHDRVLFANASEEFGTLLTPRPREAAKMPEGVHADPVNHVVLGLYPA